MDPSPTFALHFAPPLAVVDAVQAVSNPIQTQANQAAQAAAGGDSIVVPVVTLVVSLLACFVFAGTETAITAMGELRVRKLLEGHHGPDGWLRLWLKDPSRVLTTLLAGNTLASVASSAVMTSLVMDLARRYQLTQDWTDFAVAAGVTLLGAVILIGGEIAPKTLAKLHPDWFLQLMHPVWWFHLATSWLTGVMIWFAMHIVKALGGKHHTGHMEVTEEQIEDMVRIGSEAGSIDENRGDMLQGVFNLKERSVRAIMTPRTAMVALPLDATFAEVLAEVQASRYSRYPVFDKSPDKIAGVFFAKDLIDYHSNGHVPFKLEEHLHEPMFVPETVKAVDALKAFQKSSVHLAIVVDEHGGTAGVVTLEDVLEELVGDIYDEYDEPAPEIEQVAPSAWTLDASTELVELAETVDIEVPEDSSATTVGGFMIEQLGHVPKAGEQVTYNDLTFVVTEADDTHIVKVELRRDEPTTTATAGAA